MMREGNNPLSNLVWYTHKFNDDIDPEAEAETERMHVNASHYVVVSKSLNETIY